MSNGWIPIVLGKYCRKIGSGATPRGGSSIYLESGPYSLVRSQNVYNDGFYPNGLVYITKPEADKLDNVALQSGDVLLNITGDSVARCCMMDDGFLPGRVNQHVSIIRTNPSLLNNRYLRYVLISPNVQTHLLALAASGPTRNALTKQMIENLVLVVPENINEQHAIAHILGTLDDKIELNRRMSDTLEGIAHALFKSWFIDFDPVRAKAEGRQPFGMDEETAALFPDQFEDSELGEIPKGWEIVTLGDYAQIINGKSYKSEELRQSSNALVTLKSVRRGGGYNVDGLKSYSGDFKDEQIISPGEVVLACTDVTQAAEVIGKPAIVLPDSHYTNLVASQDILIIRARNDEIESPFLYQLLLTDRFQEYAYAYTNGTTVLHLEKKTLPQFDVIEPSRDILLAFNSLASPIYISIINIYNNTILLQSIRDALLPKLISGDIRVDPSRFGFDQEGEKVWEV